MSNDTINDVILSEEGRKIVLNGLVDSNKTGLIRQAIHWMAESSEINIPQDTLFNKTVGRFFPSFQQIMKARRSFELIVCSPGGDLNQMFSICDLLGRVKRSVCEVHTYATGLNASAAVPIISCGTPGRRKADKNAFFMMHDLSWGAMGTYTDMKREHAQSEVLRERMIKLLLENTKMTRDFIENIFDKNIDFYFDAEKAKELGVIDEII
jgi:ATP-dependent protease ClpP protease subunit